MMGLIIIEVVVILWVSVCGMFIIVLNSQVFLWMNLWEMVVIGEEKGVYQVIKLVYCLKLVV